MHTRAPSLPSVPPKAPSVYAGHLQPSDQPPAPLPEPPAPGSRPITVVSATDKPLPIPTSLGYGARPQSVASQSQSHARAPSGLQSVPRDPQVSHKRSVSQPASLHAHTHMTTSGIDGRYPSFPNLRSTQTEEFYDPLGPIDPSQLIYKPE
jgi:hypothetical protein